MKKLWPINTVVMVPDHAKINGTIVDQLEGRLYGIQLYNGPYIVTSDECFEVLNLPEEYKKDRKYITMNKLINGGTYELSARNANIGIWVDEEGGFLIRRQKFEDIFLFVEYHWDMPTFATAKPWIFIERSPFLEQYLKPQIIVIKSETIHGYLHQSIILEYLRVQEGNYANRYTPISKK